MIEIDHEPQIDLFRRLMEDLSSESSTSKESETNEDEGTEEKEWYSSFTNINSSMYEENDLPLLEEKPLIPHQLASPFKTGGVFDLHCAVDIVEWI